MNALARVDLFWSERVSFWLMTVHATLLIRHMSSVLLRFYRSITLTRQFQYRSEVAEHSLEIRHCLTMVGGRALHRYGW